MAIKTKIKNAATNLGRGFKTLATRHKGNVAAKLAKQLRETRGTLRSRNLRVQRAMRKKRANKLLGNKKK